MAPPFPSCGCSQCGRFRSLTPQTNAGYPQFCRDLRGVHLDTGKLEISGITAVGKNYIGPLRITSKGQVTIPQHIRERHGFMPETDVDFVERDGVVVLETSTGGRPDAADRFISAVRGSAGAGLSTDDIMRLTRDYDNA